MTHLAEDDLVLHYYGETADRAATDAHLEACPMCALAYQALSHVLEAIEAPPVPERPVGYEREVWRRLEGFMREEARGGWLAWLRDRFTVSPRLVLAGGMAALIVLAFVAGRLSKTPAETPVQSAGNGRDRILLIAVGDHLERSRMVLVELVNASSEGPVSIVAEQAGAEDLVVENRLYRQAAIQAGESSLATVLEDLERVLLEIAHAPSTLPAADLETIRQRIEGQGLLFKIRVIESRARDGHLTPAAPDSKSS